MTLIRRLIALGVAIFSVLLSAQAASAAPILWGAHIDAGSYGLPYEAPQAYNIFEQHVGRRASILATGRSWFLNGSPQEFDRARMELIRQRGSIPLLTWGPSDKGSANQPLFRTSVIAGGRYDAFIRRFAADVRNWNHPLFIRLGWEPNGWWYPWGEGRSPDGKIVNGNHPGDYVRMWRHVVDIFRSIGANNVTWTWVVNHESKPSSAGSYPPLAQMYPGNGYVNWTGMDPYNRYPGWLSFNQIVMGNGGWLRDTFHAITAIAPHKPMMMAEIASQEGTEGQKAAWIRDMLGANSGLANRSIIKAFLWFNAPSHPNSMFLESSSATTLAFRVGINAPGRFAANTFADAPAAVIAP